MFFFYIKPIIIKSILKDNYGRPDQEHVLKIKELFNTLNLQAEYKLYEQTNFDKIMSDINNLNFEDQKSSDFTEEIKLVLKNYAQKIFKRNK